MLSGIPSSPRERTTGMTTAMETIIETEPIKEETRTLLWRLKLRNSLLTCIRKGWR